MMDGVAPGFAQDDLFFDGGVFVSNMWMRFGFAEDGARLNFWPFEMAF